MKKIIYRVNAPTPRFFKVLKIIGLTLAAAGTAVVTSPVALPAIIISVAGYCVVAGSVLSAVSQLTVDGKEQ